MLLKPDLRGLFHFPLVLMNRLNHTHLLFSIKSNLLFLLFSLVYTYFIVTNYSNGVGSQVLATLVTTLPLHIQINQSM